MSVSFGCICKEKNKSKWKVLHRRCNYSYFEKPKGQRHPSNYSTVYCESCGSVGRTKAKYVSELDDSSLEEYEKFLTNVV